MASRESSAIPGERVVTVPTLSEFDDGMSDGVRLFADLVGEKRSDFELDHRTHGTVEDICRRLDDLPLAVELAVARAVTLGLDELAGTHLAATGSRGLTRRSASLAIRFLAHAGPRREGAVAQSAQEQQCRDNASAALAGSSLGTPALRSARCGVRRHHRPRRVTSRPRARPTPPRDPDCGELAGADLLTWIPQRRWGLWHDRAVFHFLTEPAEQATYLGRLTRALTPSASFILATFAPDGPDRCSGLPVRRYDATSLADTIRTVIPGATITMSRNESHTTPIGTTQPFTWVVGTIAR